MQYKNGYLIDDNFIIKLQDISTAEIRLVDYCDDTDIDNEYYIDFNLKNGGVMNLKFESLHDAKMAFLELKIHIGD